MKKFIGSAVGITGTKVLELGDWLHQKHLALSQVLYTFLRAVVANAFYFTAKAIDKERIEAAEQRFELKNQQIELDLLSSATKVRDHAVEHEDWTEEHSHAIGAIAEALITQCDWEEEHVHNYLRSVVETVDGLSYGVESDFED